MTKVSELSSQYFPRWVLKIGKFQPSVAYKSVAYKIKSVYSANLDFIKSISLGKRSRTMCLKYILLLYEGIYRHTFPPRAKLIFVTFAIFLSPRRQHRHLICSTGEYKCKRSSHLKNHMKTHTNPFKCELWRSVHTER